MCAGARAVSRRWVTSTRDDRGAVLVWFAITLPVILGAFALSLDLGRLGGLGTELQDIADAAALAAANKLDGTGQAITNADAAAFAVANNSKFAESWTGNQISEIRYAENWEDLNSGPYLDKSSEDDAKK